MTDEIVGIDNISAVGMTPEQGGKANFNSH